MIDRMTTASRWRTLNVVLAAALTACLTLAGGLSASASPATHASKWLIGFGSFGPVSTSMTVAQAIKRLHSSASSRSSTPYCGFFGLTGKLPTGLVGYAPTRGGELAMLSIGDLLGGSRKGLPKVVETAKGVRLGTTAAKLEAAYPHKLRETTVYSTKVDILPGPKGQAIAFAIDGGKVINIATGKTSILVAGEYCG